ncbi:hypothetical protein IJH16_02445 [Candidatus Saccharibacteria bacterium]|nr:hypothetical protein [Candidatus Saccharibacteria bacterium]
MDRICPNCGRTLDEFEPHCGPDGLGCLYCTTTCPNCGKEVYETDIRFGYSRTYCQYCESEVIQEEEVEEDDENYDDTGDSYSYGNYSKKKTGQNMKKQEDKLKAAKAKLRKSNIEFLKAAAKANGEPVPENLESLTDEELNAKVEPLMKKFLKTYFSNQN